MLPVSIDWQLVGLVECVECLELVEKNQEVTRLLEGMRVEIVRTRLARADHPHETKDECLDLDLVLKKNRRSHRLLKAGWIGIERPEHLCFRYCQWLRLLKAEFGFFLLRKANAKNWRLSVLPRQTLVAFDT